MLMALAGSRDLRVVAVPGGVTLPPTDGVDAGAVQTIGARFAHGQLTLEEAAELGCRACASPGGGCQFLGTAATSQVVAEALGLTVPHAALAPSGQPIWLDVARRSARAVAAPGRARPCHARTSSPTPRSGMPWSCTRPFGGSTNLLLHVPAIAHAGRTAAPRIDDWLDVNRRVPATGGRAAERAASHRARVPGRRRARGDAAPAAISACWISMRRPPAGAPPRATCSTGGPDSERRRAVRDRLRASRRRARRRHHEPGARPQRRGLTSTVAFVRGNLAPEGRHREEHGDRSRRSSGADGVYRLTGAARVFTSERAAIAAIKSTGPDRIAAGTVIVLAGRGPMGAGMEETYQVTSALKHLDVGTTRRAASPTRGSRASRPARASGTSGRKHSPADPSAASVTATASASRSIAAAAPRHHRSRRVRARGGRDEPDDERRWRRATATRPGAGPGAARRRPDSGPRSSRPAAARGVGASTMWMRSPTRSRAASRSRALLEHLVGRDVELLVVGVR